MKPGDKIMLWTLDNMRLHRAKATVVVVHDWGCLVTTKAAATGQYRATWDEMLPVQEPRLVQYEGDPCPTCGSLTLRRNGACLICDTCYNTTGCS